ncbi:MAG: translocation/assembly module TamB domain-containing protein [Elainellaceae cyanobacterium]
MTNPPSNDRPPASGSEGSSLWRKAGIATAVAGGIVIVGAGAAVVAARYFVYERLAPIVENTLTDSLNRPLEIGEVTQFSLTGITFDGAEVPTTETQSDYAVAGSVQVGLNPLQIIVDLIRDREVPISIKLVDSELFLVEGEEGWLQTELQQDEEEEEGPISIVVQKVTVENATVIANPLGSLDASVALEDSTPNGDANDVDARAGIPPDTTPEEEDQGSIVPTEDEDGAPEVRLEPVVLAGVDAVANLRNEYRDIDFEASGGLRSGGEFDINGAADLEVQRVRAALRSSDVSLPVLVALLPLPLALEQGELDSNVTVEYRGDSNQPPIESLYFQGTAQISDAIAQLEAAPQPIEDLNTSLRFDEQTIRLEDTSLRYGEIPVEAAGNVDLQEGYDIDAQVPEVTLEGLQETLNIPIPVEVAGAFEADAQVSGPLEQPVVTGDISNQGRVDLDRTAVDVVQAAFKFTPPLLTVESFRIVPTVGGEIVGDGTVNLEADGNVLANIDATIPADELAQDYGFSLPAPYQIGPLVADLEVFGPFNDIQAVAQWRLPQATYSGQGQVSYGNNALRLQDTQFQVEGGTVSADGVAQFDQQTWQANVDASGVRTGDVAPQLQGLLTADVALAGRLDNLDLAAVSAQGTARLDDTRIQPINGVALIAPGTYQTGFRWTGDGLQVDGFRGPNLRADGFIGLDPASASVVTRFDLDVVANDYELARLDPFLPDAVRAQAQLRGLASYAGQVSGTLSAPQVNGQLALDGFGVNRFTFANLAGPVQLGLGQGGQIALQGGGDRIAATVSESYIPTDFAIRNGEISLTGETAGDTLTAQLRDFPLQLLDYKPLGEAQGAVSGVVNANVEANIADLSNPSAVASLAVAEPSLGAIAADQFTGEVTYRNSAISLAAGELTQGPSLYTLDGRLALDGAQPFEANVAVQQGQLETVVAAVRLVSPASGQAGDGADAYQEGDLDAIDAGRPARPLLEQALYATKLAALNRQLNPEDQTTALIPPLEELSGTFDARLDVSGQLSSIFEGLRAEFALDGQDWDWGQYDDPNQVEVAGSLVEGTLALEPFRFQSGESLVAYSGSLGITGNQSGVLRVEQVPVPLLQSVAENFANVPVNLDGSLNALVNFDGSLVTPRVEGEAAIANAQVNGNPLDEVATEFRYVDAQLDAEARLVNQGPQKLVARASIPYALPFMAVRPATDQISAEAVLQDEALGLISVVTNNQLQWEGGNGLVRVDVSGTLEEPVVAGTAQFDDATVALQLINDPITDITGRAMFDLDQIQVADLQAKLNGGDIQVDGALPVQSPDSSTELLVSLDQVPVDLDVPAIANREVGFSATVDSKAIVSGTALDPVLGGKVQLQDGQVDVFSGLFGGFGGAGASPAAAEDATTGSSAEDGATEAEEPNLIFGIDRIRRFLRKPNAEGNFGGAIASRTPPSNLLGSDADSDSLIRFDNLEITLTDDLEVAGGSFFNVEAEGSLILNGGLANLRPDGELDLVSGWVNLYSAQFRLDRDEPNRVVLTPDEGLDPLLQVTAVADVPELERTPVAPSSPFAPSEVADQSAVPSFGGFETIEVIARIDGRLSQLQENLELESDPPRTDEQLVALIGGGLVNQFAQGDAAAGLATFVGSGNFANVSNEIADTLGIDLFRIFPATDVGDESNLPVNVGVEAGVDIANDLSVTILQLLGSTTPPQVGLRYRLTEEFQIRANTDLDEDTRGILEYQIRF